MNDVDTVNDRVGRIRPLLSGLDPIMQMSILADLISMFLVGHLVFDENDQLDPLVTQKLREERLQTLGRMAQELMPINHAMLMERRGEALN
jgi:hypothetical protein